MPIYEKQLRETETAIDNIVNAIMGGIASKALQAKLAQLEAAKEEILIRIDEEKLEKPKISADFMTFWLHKFRKLDVTKEAHRQMLVDTFVNAVFLYDDKLLLTFNFKDGTRTITFSDVQTATSENGSDLDCLAAPHKKERHMPLLFISLPKKIPHPGCLLFYSPFPKDPKYARLSLG